MFRASWVRHSKFSNNSFFAKFEKNHWLWSGILFPLGGIKYLCTELKEFKPCFNKFKPIMDGYSTFASIFCHQSTSITLWGVVALWLKTSAANKKIILFLNMHISYKQSYLLLHLFNKLRGKPRIDHAGGGGALHWSNRDIKMNFTVDL